MAKPHKSTFEALVDAFCEFPIAEQNRALELMNHEHRRARIRAFKQTARTEDLNAQRTATEALRKTNGQPVTGVLDAMREDT